MRYLLTKALILRKQPSGENDWFLTLLSPEHGKIQAISRSSRKILSQKGCHMDPLNLCDFQLYKKNDRYMVTECKLEKPFMGIKSDLQKSLLGFTILELLLTTIQESEDNFDLFGLTVTALERLNETGNEIDLEEFKIKLLKIAGSWPEVSNCHHCRHRWTSNDLINCDLEGRFFCSDCIINTHTNGQLITFNTIKLANYLSLEHKDKVNLVISEQELFHLKRLTAIFLGKYLHQELKSENVMRN